MESSETNNLSFDKKKWFNSLDYTWKRILKQSIDINSAPTEDQVDDILNLVEVDCSNSSVLSIEPLIHFKKLEKLICKKTKIKTLEKLENKTRLQYLDISSTEVANLDFLRNFPALTYLDISKTKVTSLNGIANCESLEYLYLNNTFIDDLTPLKYCKNLYSIELNSTQVSDISVLENIGVKHQKYEDTPAIDKFFDTKYSSFQNDTNMVKPFSFDYSPSTINNDVVISEPESTVQTIHINPIPEKNVIQNKVADDNSKDYTPHYFMFGGLVLLLLLMFTNFRDFNHRESQETMIQTQAEYGTVNSGSGLNLRDEANSEANILLTIPGGSQVKINSKSVTSETIDGVTANWYEIEYNNTKGWAWGGYIKIN
jgi:hypothetical protein